MTNNNKWILSDTKNGYNFYKKYNNNGSLIGYTSALIGSKKDERIINEINEDEATSHLNNELEVFIFENYNTEEEKININRRTRDDKFFKSFAKSKRIKNNIRYIGKYNLNDEIYINKIKLILKFNTAKRDEQDEEEKENDIQNYILYSVAFLPEWFEK